jgi:hypothetical protein
MSAIQTTAPIRHFNMIAYPKPGAQFGKIVASGRLVDLRLDSRMQGAQLGHDMATLRPAPPSALLACSATEPLICKSDALPTQSMLAIRPIWLAIVRSSKDPPPKSLRIGFATSPSRLPLR